MKQLLLSPINEKQKAFLESRANYLMYSGAVGAGKSFIGCVKGLLLNLRYPGNVGLICRKEASTLNNSTLRTLFEQVLPPELIVYRNDQKGLVRHKTTTPGVYSTIIWSGLDKTATQEYPTKIGSTEFGWIFLDEGVEADQGDWQMLGTRLRHKIPGLSQAANARVPRQMFTATNPDTPYHHLHEFFIQQQDHPDRQVIFTTPYENPYLPVDYIKSLENNLTGVFRDRLLLGKWVSAEGMIYKAFNPDTHVTSEGYLPISDYKQIIAGADSNYPLPRASLIIGLTGDGEAHVLEEFYQKGAQVEDLREWLEAWAEEHDRWITVYHDPSDPSAIDKLNRGLRSSALKADNKVVSGISEVSRYFDQDLIKIKPSCSNLIKELQAYRWQARKEGEKPDKSDDHAVDALRYALHTAAKHSGTPTILDFKGAI